MDRLSRLFNMNPQLRGAGGGAGMDQSVADTAETTHISSLALLKMLKHGRAGVPMEVMGLMLGEFIDEYTVSVVDVFAMPQSGTGVSVEAVDHVFQTAMLDMLKSVGRPEMVVGWYHSHPGFGCWLSGVDINCFPVEDHEIFTDRGFMDYAAVKAHFATNAALGVASYVNGNLVFADIAATDITYHAGKHNLVNMKGARNNVNIRPTDNHQMWVRAGPTSPKGAWYGCPQADQYIGPPFRFYHAGELPQLGKNDARTSVRFSAQFENGFAGIAADDSGLTLPFAAALGLQTKEQCDAFLWIYGYFLGDGWIDGTPRCAYVMFGPVKDRDIGELVKRLAVVGLPQLLTATVGAFGYWKASEPDSKGQTNFRICARSWYAYFAEQYSHKYAASDNNRAAASVGAVRRGSGLAAPRYADFLGDSAAITPMSDIDPAGSPHPPDAEDIDSAKWFWYWVFKRLNKRQLRIIIAGLYLADGHSAENSAHSLICTASLRFRDELHRVCIMAGYTADWEINYEAGTVTGVNKQGKQIIAGTTGWKVRYHDYPREAQPRINAADITVDQQVTGHVWCVTVPAPHLIMVRRILEKDNGQVKLASRPLIVGNTQQSFEALNKRAVAVVVDPIQSVKGKVVIDAFRLINPQLMMLGHAPRQTTSNLGHLRKPSIQALIHNLNRHYYSINIAYKKNDLEQSMLLNLHKNQWTAGLTIDDTIHHSAVNAATMKAMCELASTYKTRLDDEKGKTSEQLTVANVGRIDPKKHLENHVEALMNRNIVQTLATMIDTIIF